MSQQPPFKRTPAWAAEYQEKGRKEEKASILALLDYISKQASEAEDSHAVKVLEFIRGQVDFGAHRSIELDKKFQR